MGANRRVGLAPTGKRRLFTAHAVTGRSREHDLTVQILVRLSEHQLAQLMDFKPLMGAIRKVTTYRSIIPHRAIDKNVLTF